MSAMQADPQHTGKKNQDTTVYRVGVQVSKPWSHLMGPRQRQSGMMVRELERSKGTGGKQFQASELGNK